MLVGADRAPLRSHHKTPRRTQARISTQFDDLVIVSNLHAGVAEHDRR